MFLLYGHLLKPFYLQIHPKMIHNRPPLNCQKCQFRFFTDQGLERHLLGSHGLVTSSMQEAANKGKDAGRCPVCGRVSTMVFRYLSILLLEFNAWWNIVHKLLKSDVKICISGIFELIEKWIYLYLIQRHDTQSDCNKYHYTSFMKCNVSIWTLVFCCHNHI